MRRMTDAELETNRARAQEIQTRHAGVLVDPPMVTLVLEQHLTVDAYAYCKWAKVFLHRTAITGVLSGRDLEAVDNRLAAITEAMEVVA